MGICHDTLERWYIFTYLDMLFSQSQKDIERVRGNDFESVVSILSLSAFEGTNYYYNLSLKYKIILKFMLRNTKLDFVLTFQQTNINFFPISSWAWGQEILFVSISE